MLIYHGKHIIVISEERQFVKNYAIFSFVLEDKNTPKEKGDFWTTFMKMIG